MCFECACSTHLAVFGVVVEVAIFSAELFREEDLSSRTKRLVHREEEYMLLVDTRALTMVFTQKGKKMSMEPATLVVCDIATRDGSDTCASLLGLPGGHAPKLVAIQEGRR